MGVYHEKLAQQSKRTLQLPEPSRSGAQDPDSVSMLGTFLLLGCCHGRAFPLYILRSSIMGYYLLQPDDDHSQLYAAAYSPVLAKFCTVRIHLWSVHSAGEDLRARQRDVRRYSALSHFWKPRLWFEWVLQC